MTICYDIHGDGPVGILILHEWLADHRNWDLVRPYLDPARVCCIFADLRGYGRSRRIRGVYSLAEAVADSLELMDRLAFSTFAVVGHSMSGRVAQKIARIAPARVQRLLLISPVPEAGLPLDGQARAGMAAVATDDGAARKAISARISGRYSEVWIECKLRLARSAVPPDVQLSYLDLICAPEPEEQIGRSDIPVRCLLGRHDILPYQQASVSEALNKRFRRVEYRICDEAGHYAMLEVPPLVATEINAMAG